MHFLLAYQVQIEGDQCNIIHQSVKNVLKPYNAVNVFGDTYVVEITKQTDWEDIRIGLTNITRENGCDCKFIMTPIIKGGYYNGWLDSSTWPEISSIIEKN